MSWLDRIDTQITITTGDGKSYTPLWKNASKSIEFNVSEFNFQNVQGTLVYRGEAMGRKFPIEIYFTGENNLEDSLAFEESSKDKRAWVISHPFYDDILVHPVGLNFDNSQYNVTKITGVVLETLSDIYPKSSINEVDRITQLKTDCDEEMANDFVASVPEPSAADVQTLTENTEEIYNNSEKVITETSDAETFKQALSTANNAIAVATSEPLAAIRSAQALISLPSQFQTSVENRLNTLASNFEKLRDGIVNFTLRSDKFIFENNAGTTLSSMMFAAANPEVGNYTNRSDVINVIEKLQLNYNQFIIDLDGLQTDNNGTEQSYIPNAAGLSALARIYNFTVANLLGIAIGGKQERSVILTAYSNPILLTHRFYGLDELDENLETFINQNNIGINEMLEIKAGRKVIYYV